MSTRPGVNITLSSTPPSRTLPTDVGTWFVVGTTDAGPLDPVFIRSISDFERLLGSRTSYSGLYDALDVFFREGGSRAYVRRVVGPAAVAASLNLLDAGAAISLVATALGPGSYYNSIKVGVRAGGGAGTFVVFVEDANNVEVETSPDLVDTNAAAQWSQGSSYIRLTQGASVNDPAVVAAAPLVGGNDDRANITDAQWLAALNDLTSDLGSGQVSAPGDSTDTRHQQLLAHAAANRRVAILDAPNTPTVGTLEASASAARAGNQRFGAMFWPWLLEPGFVSGTTRVVPPCASVAAKLAVNDSNGLGADTPAAGDNGILSYATGLSQSALDDSTRQTLNSAGINVIRSVLGAIRIYGWRSLVDSVADPDWVDFGNSRLYMAIASDGDAIAEGFVLQKIDGQGKMIARFNGALSGMLQDYWNNGDLYGTTAGDAFFVDTGNQVNTPTTIANGELHATLNVRMSPFAEMVNISIYKKTITEGVV